VSGARVDPVGQQRRRQVLVQHEFGGKHARHATNLLLEKVPLIITSNTIVSIINLIELLRYVFEALK
jgi:hypothetical protein